jgi:hypothetical protein
MESSTPLKRYSLCRNLSFVVDLMMSGWILTISSSLPEFTRAFFIFSLILLADVLIFIALWALICRVRDNGLKELINVPSVTDVKFASSLAYEGLHLSEFFEFEEIVVNQWGNIFKINRPVSFEHTKISERVKTEVKSVLISIQH